jgi:positive regulator of sigma E activity
MKRNKTNPIANLLYLIAAIAILVGAFFKLQHYNYGYAFIFVGFLVGTAASYIHIKKLNTVIKNLEDKKSWE